VDRFWTQRTLYLRRGNGTAGRFVIRQAGELSTTNHPAHWRGDYKGHGNSGGLSEIFVTLQWKDRNPIPTNRRCAFLSSGLQYEGRYRIVGEFCFGTLS
jgi:hypothetical protein